MCLCSSRPGFELPVGDSEARVCSVLFLLRQPESPLHDPPNTCPLLRPPWPLTAQWLSSRTHLQCRSRRRHGFDPWVRKILWRRAWQLPPVFLPGEYRGQRSLVGYSPWGCKESATTEGAWYMACADLFQAATLQMGKLRPREGR